MTSLLELRIVFMVVATILNLVYLKRYSRSPNNVEILRRLYIYGLCMFIEIFINFFTCIYESFNSRIFIPP